MQELADLSETFAVRPVLIRHKAFAFYRPAAFAIAQTLSDLPVMALSSVAFALPIFFMTNLARTASQFFIFLFFTYVLQIVMYGFFRGLVALMPSLDGATPLAGIGVQALVVYSGYIIPYGQIDATCVGSVGYVALRMRPFRFADTQPDADQPSGVSGMVSQTG